MIWGVLFLMSILSAPDNTRGDRSSRKRDLRSRGNVVYVNADHCPYPCTCGTGRDICEECQECPRQLGEPCNQEHQCDVQRGLVCRYKHGDSEGVCRESSGVPCVVYNRTYEHGETFTLDCRTQCACQVGIVASAGGKDLSSAISNAMKKVFNREMSTQFSAVGRKGKKNFSSLVLYKVVVEAVKRHYPDATENVIRGKISAVLATSADREGGRKSRNKKNEEPQTAYFIGLSSESTGKRLAAKWKSKCGRRSWPSGRKRSSRPFGGWRRFNFCVMKLSLKNNNGTYGCSSLCPQEHISPKGSCQHPRLVDVPDQCCREWMCDSQTAEQPPSCQPAFSRWSPCTSECGGGLSSRRSNLNARCQPDTETRICQTRRCPQDSVQEVPSELKVHHKKQHHLRRGHECKATHRLSTGVYLRFGPCSSRKRFRPKYCGLCPTPGVKCDPILSTTVKVDFICEGGPQQAYEHTSELLPEYLEPGEDLWTDLSRPWIGQRILREDQQEGNHQMTVSVQWILKCRCEHQAAESDGVPPTSSTGEVILHRVHRTAAP